jgi:hypothetical protein
MVNIQNIIRNNNLLLFTFNISIIKKPYMGFNIQNIIESKTTHSLLI